MTAQQLKNSILNLAISGKLVPQDPHDEPASKLVEQIRKEKDRLIKEKKIKPSKIDSVIYRDNDNLHYEKIGRETRCIEDEIPFEIPQNWSWVRLRNYIKYDIGKTPPRKEEEFWVDAKYPWITIADMIADKKIYSTKDEINSLALRTHFKDKLVPIGTLIMSFKLTVGRVSILGVKAVHNEAIISIYPFIDDDKIATNFLFKFLPLLSEQGKTKKAIKGNTLNSDSLNNILLPLPPLPEQKRIVDKFEEILPLVEKYKENKEKLDELNLNFPSRLKKSILDYAIKGKLVEQNLEDESVEILLQKIRQEKQRLIKDKKLKADKFPQSTIFIGEDNSPYEKIGRETRCIEDEIPFEIPQNWSWVRLRNYIKYDIGKTPPRKEEEFWVDAKYPWITIADMIADKKIYSTKDEINSLALRTHFKDKLVPIGTLIMSFKLTVGRVSILGVKAVHNEAIISIYPFIDDDKIATNFLFKFLPLLSEQGKTKKAIKGNTLNSDSLNNILLPLPPLPEQKRIVAKIEELLKFIDILQSSLK